jgi:hypothetical protein
MTNEEIAKAVEAVKDCQESFGLDLSAVKETLLQFARKARAEGARDALSVNLTGAPMTDEEVESVLEINWNGSDLSEDNQIVLILTLVEQIRWLSQCLRDAAHDTWGDGYRAGYEAAHDKLQRQLDDLPRIDNSGRSEVNKIVITTHPPKESCS